ncbi:acyl carrier protein [bacterium]|nr:acyl carrier protein [bacterium]
MSLQEELIKLIFDVCEIDGYEEGAIGHDDPLLGPAADLELDSLDVLEIVIVIQKKYGIKIENKSTAIEILESANTLAGFVEKERQN